MNVMLSGDAIKISFLVAAVAFVCGYAFFRKRDSRRRAVLRVWTWSVLNTIKKKKKTGTVLMAGFAIMPLAHRSCDQ